MRGWGLVAPSRLFGILSALASTLADKTKSAKLRTVTSVDEVLDLLTPEEEE